MIAGSFLTCASVWPASPASDSGRRTLLAVRTSAAPVLDGEVDEPCWEQAPQTTGFIDSRTGRPAQKQTIVRVLYDDTHIYVSFECLEPDPSKIQATQRKYDRRIYLEDYVRVQFDTFLDRRRQYIFIANALGTRRDGRAGLFGLNMAWDSDWQTAVKIRDDRWICEMAIPIDDMLFNRGGDVTWGINFIRGETELEEISIWNYRDETQSDYAARESGDLTGLDLSEVQVKPQPRYEYYVSATGGSGEVESEASTGIDAALRLGPQWTSSFTINPDYGHVDADADTVELRDTERFLPERRAFFRDGAELFESPVQIYYSRRFANIDAGAKLTGTGTRWTAGILDVKGEINRHGERHAGNYAVGRATYSLGENSHIGGIYADSLREDGYNRTGGLDTRLYFSDTVSWTGQILHMQDKEEVIKVDDDGYEYTEIVEKASHAFDTELSGGRNPFTWELKYEDIGADFQPDLGFIRRKDIRGPSIELAYRKEDAQGWADQYGGMFRAKLYENHKSETTLRDYFYYGWVNLAAKVDISAWHRDDFHAPFNNRQTGLRIRLASGDQWRGADVTYRHGIFEEVPYDQVSVEKGLKIGERFTLEATGDYRMEDKPLGNESVWLWRLVNEYTFPWEGRIKLTAEETSLGRHNVTFLFAYEDVGKIDYYLLLNDVESNKTRSQGAFFKTVFHF